MEGDLGSSLMQLGDTINILQVNFRNVLASNQWHGYAMCQGLLCETMDQIFSNRLGSSDLSEQRNIRGV